MKCSAKRSSDGQPCRNWAIQGGTVCRNHGGSAPQVKAAAAMRQLDEKLSRLVERMEVAPVGNPLAELQQLAGEVIAWKNLLAERVAELRSTGYRGAGGEQIRADVVLFERALDRCATVLTAIARLNIDERLAAISEHQATMVRRAIDAALASAGLAGPQATAMRQSIARHLRVLAAGDGAIPGEVVSITTRQPIEPA